MYRTIKITAGMTGEFEIIGTNASDELIEEQLVVNSARQEDGIEITNPYDIIEAEGCIVNVIGCQDDFDNENMENIVIDEEFDYYDY